MYIHGQIIPIVKKNHTIVKLINRVFIYIENIYKWADFNDIKKHKHKTHLFFWYLECIILACKSTKYLQPNHHIQEEVLADTQDTTLLWPCKALP